MIHFTRIATILNNLEKSIINKIPFSLIRLGDGGIKLIHAFKYGDTKQLNNIIKREGLPSTRVEEYLKLLGKYASNADYIDSPEIYFDEEKFWDRCKSLDRSITFKTSHRLRMWEELYEFAGIKGKNYCNPESNYLMLLKIGKRKNLLDIMKGRKICLITAVPEVEETLKKRGYDVEIVPIVGHFQNQHKNSFKGVIEEINLKAKYFDLWLVAAGELGRLYTGRIKEKGGRVVDIGFIVEFWNGGELDVRLRPFIRRSEKEEMELVLTREGRKYQKFI